MPLSIIYRKGTLEDLTKFRISADLATTNESVEFNLLGRGHEFWIAVEEDVIIGFTAVGRSTLKRFIIIALEVAASHKNRGVGSGLIRAILANYPDSEFSVIPLEGTEAFYKRLGFESATKWEMRKKASNSRAG
jgi:N-acetylglutamate synthase-like GNAT family acetyltransferase